MQGRPVLRSLKIAKNKEKYYNSLFIYLSHLTERKSMPLDLLSMPELKQIYHILDEEDPNFNKIGKLTKEGRWSYLINSIGHRIEPRLLYLIKKINQSFTHLEQKGVKIFDAGIEDRVYQEKARLYREGYQIYFRIAERMEDQLLEIKNQSPELKQAYHELQCREIGLRYSLGKANGGLDALEESGQEQLQELIQRAQSWKKGQKLAIDQELNELELEQLKKLATYPEWLKVVYKNPVYLAEVFNWCLRDDNSVEVIVKCYETRRCLKGALLSSSLGYVRDPTAVDRQNDVIAFRTQQTKIEHVAKRVLTASIYHGSFKHFEPGMQERVNILKPSNVIHFKGNYLITVKNLWKESAQKNAREVNINLCADWGFVNFHPVRGSWNGDKHCYDMPAMTEKDWVDYVPAGRIISHEALVEQYGDKIKDRSFFFKVMSTREHLDLNALDCHAWWQLYIRMEDGKWKVTNIGTYAYRFQKGIIDGLSLFCATVKRVLSLMDQNCNYTHRQRAGYPIFPEEQKGQAVLNRIYRLMLATGVFQFTGRNCAYAVQTITQKIIKDLPNFFLMPISQAKTGIPPVDWLLAWANSQGKKVCWLVITLLHTLLLSYRNLSITKVKGQVCYSVKEYLKKRHEIYNPAFLPYQIAKAHQTGEEPFVNGELYWGHTEEKLYAKAVAQQLRKNEENLVELIEPE